VIATRTIPASHLGGAQQVSPARGALEGTTGAFAPTPRKSSIFFGRMIGLVLMRVNSKCAHQVRPPPMEPVATEIVRADGKPTASA
jgi:hypothetical protein